MSKEKAYQFFRLVERMRTAQREYFKSKSRSALQESKALEARVDEEIAKANQILGTTPPKQATLFNNQ